MKNLMKIATALCLLGTCQFGWAGRGKKYEDSIAEQSKPKCVKNIEVSKTPMRPGPESLPISASTSSASTGTAQSTTAQPAETASVSSSTSSSNSSRLSQSDIQNMSQKLWTQALEESKGNIKTIEDKFLDLESEFYKKYHSSGCYDDYKTILRKLWKNLEELLPLSSDERALQAIVNQCYIKGHVECRAFEALAWEDFQEKYQPSDPNKLKQDKLRDYFELIMEYAFFYRCDASHLTYFFVNINNELSVIRIPKSDEEQQKIDTMIETLKSSSKTSSASTLSTSTAIAQSTTAQSAESTPVSSSASSSSSSAWTSEDEKIYGPQIPATLTQEADAIWEQILKSTSDKSQLGSKIIDWEAQFYITTKMNDDEAVEKAEQITDYLFKKLHKMRQSQFLTSASTSSASTGTAEATIAQSAETIATGSSSSISTKKKINILWSKGEDCRREYNCINKLSSGEDLDVNRNLAHWLTYFNKPAMVAAIFAFANQIQKTKSL